MDISSLSDFSNISCEDFASWATYLRREIKPILFEWLEKSISERIDRSQRRCVECIIKHKKVEVEGYSR